MEKKLRKNEGKTSQRTPICPQLCTCRTLRPLTVENFCCFNKCTIQYRNFACYMATVPAERAARRALVWTLFPIYLSHGCPQQVRDTTSDPRVDSSHAKYHAMAPTCADQFVPASIFVLHESSIAVQRNQRMQNVMKIRHSCLTVVTHETSNKVHR